MYLLLPSHVEAPRALTAAQPVEAPGVTAVMQPSSQDVAY